jgi:hypothetical protein
MILRRRKTCAVFFKKKKPLNIQSLKDLDASSKECIVQGIKNPRWNIQGYIVPSPNVMTMLSTAKSKVTLIKKIALPNYFTTCHIAFQR